MKSARVIFVDGKYYPQIKGWFFWKYITEGLSYVWFHHEDLAIHRAKVEAQGTKAKVVWENDDYGA